MLPNFIIGGTSAGGTSFLSAAIIQHPEIYLPAQMRPEPHYFYKSWEYERPVTYYEEKYFSAVKDEKAIGERSSSYMFGENVAERMFKHIPNIKLIFTLRNPIERAYANYRYTVLEGLEELSFEEALQQEKQRIKAQSGIWAEIQPYNYTGRGFYYRQLQRFLTLFPRENILILKSEDMNRNPQDNFTKVFEFLHVSREFTPSIPPNFSSSSVKDRGLQTKIRKYFQNKYDEIVEGIRKNDEASGLLATDQDFKMYELLKANIVNKKEVMPQSCREYLQKLYYDDMENLKSLVYFSIDDWS